MSYKVFSKDLSLALVFFSTIFYIKYILIKPAYIVLFGFILYSLINQKYIIYKSYFFVSYLYVAFLIWHLVYLGSDPGMILNAIISILCFPIFLFYMKDLNIRQIKIFLNICIVYLLIEVIWRLLHPVYEIDKRELVSQDGSGWYYPYKMSSFIFTDSNYVALHIFCLIFISLLFRLKWHSLILFILMMLTISRSGILGAIIIFLYFYIDSTKFSKYLRPLFVCAFIFGIFYLLLNISVLTDGSFNSKFFIINSAIEYTKSHFVLFDYIFGVGLSHSFDLIDIGAHNIFVVLLFETGVLGFISYFMFFSVFLSKKYYYSHRGLMNYLVYLFVFLLMGFSLGLYLFPIMILTIAFILRGSKDVV
ncbi:O-antigen ligase family protein [Acinetobacter ursingii]|uniref:O-antigen ligase family protein n=1 Tax=Acinetobacter ursingii TaxID=108980 RepID=UPI0021CFCE82|nr:O-antigen ligase family protein [Acinetobacter ursingii]